MSWDQIWLEIRIREKNSDPDPAKLLGYGCATWSHTHLIVFYCTVFFSYSAMPTYETIFILF